MQRPDLTHVDAAVIAYIEHLEGLLKIKARQSEIIVERPVDTTPLPAEPPTTQCIITISRQGMAKRTYRHLYSRQHRGGMGVFDLDVNEPDYPSLLVCAEEGQNLLLFTNRARAFRISTGRLEAQAVRSKGEYLLERLPIENEETLTAVLPERANGYITLVSRSGRIRCLRHHLFGEHMKPGTAMYRYEDFGPLAAVAWTPGDADLFIATRKGMAIRFSEKLVPPQGDWGIRLNSGDEVVTVTAVYPDGDVFLLGSDGKGTIRQMSGFAANKSMGGSGKIAIKTDHLVGATAVEANEDIFVITRLGKMIRFMSDEVPPTEGTIQGVNCLALRADEPVALIKSPC